jgi:transcriptional antiterminator RfaH
MTNIVSFGRRGAPAANPSHTEQTAPPACDWYLIHTKVRQERCAQENLERQGYSCFLPQLLSEKLRRGVLTVVQEPLFPRYLFIRLDAGLEAKGWGPIRSTLGVTRLVTFGNQPAKISDALVGSIRAQTEESIAPKTYFEAGQALVVTDGPFMGLEAIYQMQDGESRVMVLLNILSKPVQLAIAPTSLRKLH